MYVRIAVIPARGGSKSVPNKNILDVGGKPLIVWSIESAQSIRVDRVIVTTDSNEIQEIAKQHGAEVIRRPKCLSDDHSTDYQWCQHLLQELDPHLPELIVQLRPTHPFRESNVLNEAIGLIHQCYNYVDSLRSVSIAKQTPYKMWSIESITVDTTDDLIPNITTDKLVPILPAPDSMIEPYNMPRQRLPVMYWQNGYVDITKPQTVLVKQSMTGDIILPFVTDTDEPDIDYSSDLALIKAHLNKSNPFPS